jgi:hypothetical protein
MGRNPLAAAEGCLPACFAGWLGWLTAMLVKGVFGAVVTLAAIAPLACFSLKQPPCAFSCAEPSHLCPANYTCGTDDLCHREGATVTCGLTSPVDAGPDAVDSADGTADGAQ